MYIYVNVELHFPASYTEHLLHSLVHCMCLPLRTDCLRTAVFALPANRLLAILARSLAR